MDKITAGALSPSSLSFSSTGGQTSDISYRANGFGEFEFLGADSGDNLFAPPPAPVVGPSLGFGGLLGNLFRLFGR
jgi:hypothetical protein